MGERVDGDLGVKWKEAVDVGGEHMKRSCFDLYRRKGPTARVVDTGGSDYAKHSSDGKSTTAVLYLVLPEQRYSTYHSVPRLSTTSTSVDRCVMCCIVSAQLPHSNQKDVKISIAPGSVTCAHEARIQHNLVRLF